MQSRWLARRLEYHLLGNHLFTNAKALVFAGSYFEGSEAGSWLARGLAILDRELPEQILGDGGHFELSPMYHSLALEDLLDLINVARWAGHPQYARWRDRIAPMRGWLAAMCHPDGEIAFFNDAAFGVAPSPIELDGYAKRLGFPVVAEIAPAVGLLPDSGYVRVERGPVVALLDVARIGPDHLPGHAHADTLSFELSLNGQRAIVNSGTSIYGVGPERLRQRGTSAHSTVTIEDENSSEVWSGFRVARRARPQGLSVLQDDGGWTIVCAHDGYGRLPGHPRHRRTWQFHDLGFIVSDSIEGGHSHAVVAFHFHPNAIPSAAPNGLRGALAVSPGVALNWQVETGHAAIEPSTWHPEFGLSLPSYRLLVTPISGESVVRFSWGEV